MLSERDKTLMEMAMRGAWHPMETCEYVADAGDLCSQCRHVFSSGEVQFWLGGEEGDLVCRDCAEPSPTVAHFLEALGWSLHPIEYSTIWYHRLHVALHKMAHRLGLAEWNTPTGWSWVLSIWARDHKTQRPLGRLFRDRLRAKRMFLITHTEDGQEYVAHCRSRFDIAENKMVRTHKPRFDILKEKNDEADNA